MTALKNYIWLDGKLVERNAAKFDIITHSMQYGSGIFEGIRSYKTDNGVAIFRLKDHMERFLRSAKIYDMVLGYTLEELEEATVSILKKNKLEHSYIRPFAFYNNNEIGLNTDGKRISVAIAAVEFGSYLGGMDKGIKCIISSWRRINSQILPVQAKASGNYLNSILASHEAKTKGAEEAIMLGINGYVAEGPGENIFLVKNNELITPSEESDILMGITRDSIIKIAENKGLIVNERLVHREEIYTADELFFTGTAAEITPITYVDGKKIGKGHVGPLTKMLADSFFDATLGKNKEFDWISIV